MSLKHGVHLSYDVKQLVKELKEEYNLTDYEALKIALQAENNELIKLGFVISSSDSSPNGLEAIAIALGYGK